MMESDYLKDNFKFLRKLREIPTLEAFTDDDLKGFLQLSKVRRYEPGELILAEGHFDCWIYFLVSGKVRVVKQGEDLSILERTGDLFGEMGIIDGSPRSASVYAIEKTICLATDASCIDRLSGNNKIAFCYLLYRVFAEMLAIRLRLTSEELIRVREETKHRPCANHPVGHENVLS